MPNYRETLRSIRTFPALIKFLQNELDWPIESTDFEDITFDYSPEELGIEAASAAKIQEIKRLRPLTVNQPWGIFFLKFEPKRLPVVVLRRVLSRVVMKKRASANSEERAAWKAEDLLFISNYGEGEQRQITLAHFPEERVAGNRPPLKVLGWDGENTDLHLDKVAEVLRDKLCWPENIEDVEHWRETWSAAFTLRHREVITTSKQLAERLAELARGIRRKVRAVLAVESDKGPLRKLMTAFREALIHDLTDDDFADMYAQTIAYGMLTARVSRPAGPVADNDADMVPITNPFLKELMETFLHVGGRRRNGRGDSPDFDELGVNEVEQLLLDANMDAVLRDFGDRNPQEDPVIHFYELFLKEYDAKKRMQRGVFYTPRPVVSYIVRSVDELLRTEFELKDGLADTATWGEMAKRIADLKIPEGVKPGDPFVQILDPATGTGTFLVETIDLIYKRMTAKWKAAGHGEKKIVELWNDYVPKHLLPRLYGYELLMAPYAIAHMKIGLKLFETGYRFGSDERARVYLTNALEPAQDFSDTFDFGVLALAHEAQAVNVIKQGQRFTVIIGNPPYSDSLTENAWIMGLITDFKKGLNEKKSDLNREEWKFLRAMREFAGEATPHIGGFVINNAFLRALTHRQLRRYLLDNYGRIDIYNLHGSSRPPEYVPLQIQRQEGISALDGNVFDIMQGVTVAFFSTSSSTSQVNYAEAWGTSDRKLKLLSTLVSTDVPWQSICPSDPYYFFTSHDNSLDAEYSLWPSLPALIHGYTSGIQTGRDAFASTVTQAEMQSRIKAIQAGLGWEQIAPGTKTPKWVGFSLTSLRREKELGAFAERWLYSPFDVRPLLLHPKAIKRTRMPAMDAMRQGEIGICTVRQVFAGPWQHVFVSRNPISDTSVSNKSREYPYVFPSVLSSEYSDLYEMNQKTSLSQLALEFVTKIFGSLVREYTDLFVAYVYAVLHSPSFRVKYKQQLSIDFPRIPMTSDRVLASSLATIGAQLVALHLGEAPVQQALSVRFDESAPAWFYEVADGQCLPVALTFVGPAEPAIEKVSWSDDTVWLDRAQTRGFQGVPEDVWQFHIGGYQVCEKWLKDRKGRTLSAEDITHYHRIVIALYETIRLMREIDLVIDEHGGWPDAFAGKS